METSYVVRSMWDGEAGVWVATSDDVPGLVAEAESIDALSEKLKVLVPELLDVNGVDQDQEASTEFQAIRARNVISAYRTSHWLVYSLINPWSE